MGDYFLRICSQNGTISGLTAQLTFETLAPGDTYVLAHQNASPAILAIANHTSSALDFNGDDTITLSTWNGTNYPTHDSIGQWDFDPGTAWVCGGDATSSVTMRRLPSICDGDTDETDPYSVCSGWSFHPIDDTSDLGQHMTDCGTVATENMTWSSLKANYR